MNGLSLEGSEAAPMASGGELPLYDILQPTDGDVLSGRGVTTNRHEGNTNFRSLVALNKELYVTSTKRQKMQISRSIVDAVRSRGGRFLEKNPVSGLWSDIGDRKAIEKTSQALRDGAASLRKQLSADLGDPDFISAVFEESNDDQEEKDGEEDAAKEKGGTSKGKEMQKSPRPKTVPKKSHRRTKSNPDSVKEAAKQKNMIRKMKSMDIPGSPRPTAYVVNSSPITSPPRIHSQPVSPRGGGYIRNAMSFDGGPYSGHPNGRHRSEGSARHRYFQEAMPSRSFEGPWHYSATHRHPLSQPSIWQHHNPRRYGTGQPPMSPMSRGHMVSPTRAQHGTFSPRGDGAYTFMRSPIERQYSSSSYTFGPGGGGYGSSAPMHSGYSDGGLAVPALGDDYSVGSVSGHRMSRDHHEQLTPRRSPYFVHSPMSTPKEFLPPISPASNRRPGPRIERTPSNMTDELKPMSPTMSSNAYKENSINAHSNVVQVYMEEGDESPKIVISRVSMDEARSDSPDRPEVEIVLGEGDHLYRELSGLSDFGRSSEHKLDDDDRTNSECSMSPLQFDKSESGVDALMDLSDSDLMHMPIAPCGPHDHSYDD